MKTRLWTVPVLVLVCSCSAGEDSSNATADGGIASDAGSTPPIEETDAAPSVDTPDAAPATPTLASLPVLTPCLPGWREVVNDGITVCDPWPVEGEQTCIGGEMHLPGHAGCEPIGNACPVGKWAEGLPASGVIYVDSVVGTGPQQGTEARPYGTIVDALAAASPGDTIALAKGVYEGAFAVATDVSIVGACADETKLTMGHVGDFFRSQDSCQLLIDVQGADLTLKDLQLADSYTLVYGTQAASVHLDSVAAYHSIQPIMGEFTAIDINKSSIDPDGAFRSTSCGGPVAISRPPSLAQPGANYFGGGTGTVASPLIVNAVNGLPTEVTACPEKPAGLFTGIALQACQLRLPSTAILALGPATPPQSMALGISESVVEDLISTSDDDITTISHSSFSNQNFLGPLNLIGSINSTISVSTESDLTAVDSVADLRTSGLTNQIGRHQGPVIMRCPTGDETMQLSDIVVEGSAAAFLGACDATIDRVSVQHSNTGVTAFGGANLEIRDLTVRAISEAYVSQNSAPALPVALGAYSGAQVNVTGFVLSQSEVVGAQLGPAGSALVLQNGLIEGNLVGANIQVPQYDLTLLEQAVTWTDNAVNIDAQSLTPPEPPMEWACADGIDNDGDGAIDCADRLDCELAPACRP